MIGIDLRHRASLEMIFHSGSPPSVPRDGDFGDAHGLIAVSGGDAFRSRREEVCIALEDKGEQTLLGGRVRLDPAVAQNVGDVIAALG